MNELIANLHNHTIYSDGSGTHSYLIDRALDAAIDVLIVTDHNVLVEGADRVVTRGDRRVMLLAAEEVHDQNRQPQKNHTLVIGANREVAQFAYSPQELIDEVNKAGGMTFLAHPNESALPMFHEPDISWVDWDVSGFTGLEIWNHFSEFKDAARSLWRTLFYAFFPDNYPVGPRKDTLARWDSLLAGGARVVGIGGSDSHALLFRRAFLHKIIFPYTQHFRSVNTHLLINQDLNNDLEHDRALVFDALRKGSAFVGYDLPASTRGFRFTAETEDALVSMGETIAITNGATFRIHLPMPAHTRLIFNGKVLRTWEDTSQMVATGAEAGAYRVECTIDYHGLQRGWIFSNPIYLVKKGKYGDLE